MAAGQGFKTFATGDVLSASDVNGYLMQGVLVFADATARTSAITSPQEGQYSYLKDTNSTEYYTGSTWVAVSGSSSPLTTKGDLYTYSTTNARLPVGTNGYTLVADSSASTGLKWAAPASGGFVGAIVYNSGNFSVSNGTWTLITWDSELIDTDGFHSTSSNTDRFTIPAGKAGKYCVTMNFSIGAGSSTIESYFGKNTDNYAFIGATGNATSKNFTVTRQTYISLAEGDYVYMRLIQGSGATQDVLGGAGQSTFSIEYLGA